jgi:hypothetical protein
MGANSGLSFLERQEIATAMANATADVHPSDEAFARNRTGRFQETFDAGVYPNTREQEINDRAEPKKKKKKTIAAIFGLL